MNFVIQNEIEEIKKKSKNFLKIQQNKKIRKSEERGTYIINN